MPRLCEPQHWEGLRRGGVASRLGVPPKASERLEGEALCWVPGGVRFFRRVFVSFVSNDDTPQVRFMCMSRPNSRELGEIRSRISGILFVGLSS